MEDALVTQSWIDRLISSIDHTRKLMNVVVSLMVTYFSFSNLHRGLYDDFLFT